MSQKEDKQRIYNSKEWRMVRNAKREHDPLCELCLERGKWVPTQAIHHIIPIETATDFRQMKELAFRYSNLMSVCFECHAKIHKELKSQTREGHQKASQAAVDRWLAIHKAKTGGQTTGMTDEEFKAIVNMRD